MEHDDPNEQRRFPPVSEGYDRAAVDAYLRQLAGEVDALMRASGELHERVRALGRELGALTASLAAGETRTSASPHQPVAAPAATPLAALPEQPPTTVRFEPSVVGATSKQVEHAAPGPSGGEQDLDGARLVALNMALEGQPREQADAYLAERFQLHDRAKLLDEVYAALER